MSANDRTGHQHGTRAARRRIAAAAAWAALALAARGHYAQYGDGMQTILAGTLDHAGLQVQTAMTWTNDLLSGSSYAFSAAFAAPTADAVHVSRLWLTLWGGTRDYTCNLQVGINGIASPFASLTLGTTNDANAVFSTTQANVYGTGFGVWLVGLPVPTNSVKTDGTVNVFDIVLNDPAGQFDKRCVQATFLSLYEDMGLANRLSWSIGEGSGDIYRGTAGAAASSSLTLGPTPGGTVDAAVLRALYTYGDYAQNDRLIFNGTSIGGDNVADHAGNYTGLTYVPDLVAYDVSGLLAATNAVRFSVDTADGVPDTRESSLRPSVAVLAVSQPIPEPCAAGLLLLGIVAAATAGRRRG